SSAREERLQMIKTLIADRDAYSLVTLLLNEMRRQQGHGNREVTALEDRWSTESELLGFQNDWKRITQVLARDGLLFHAMELRLALFLAKELDPGLATDVGTQALSQNEN